MPRQSKRERKHEHCPPSYPKNIAKSKFITSNSGAVIQLILGLWNQQVKYFFVIILCSLIIQWFIATCGCVITGCAGLETCSNTSTQQWNHLNEDVPCVPHLLTNTHILCTYTHCTTNMADQREHFIFLSAAQKEVCQPTLLSQPVVSGMSTHIRLFLWSPHTAQYHHPPGKEQRAGHVTTALSILLGGQKTGSVPYLRLYVCVYCMRMCVCMCIATSLEGESLLCSSHQTDNYKCLSFALTFVLPLSSFLNGKGVHTQWWIIWCNSTMQRHYHNVWVCEMICLLFI